MGPRHRLRLATEEDLQLVPGWAPRPEDVALFAGSSLRHPVTVADLLATQRAGWEVFVLEDQRGPCGTGSLRISPDGYARIARVLVDPGRRGEGLGRSLVALLVARAEAVPTVHTIALAVLEGNAIARGLYDRLGFFDTGRRSPGVLGDVVWTSLELERLRVHGATARSVRPCTPR